MNTTKDYTVLLWPGMGYILFPFEVKAKDAEEALERAFERSKKENYQILHIESTKEELERIKKDYEKEILNFCNRRKITKVTEEELEEFITGYLNYYFLSYNGIYLNMDNTRIEEGWNLYENSIPLEI